MIALFPFTWMAATSLKTNAELYDPKAMPLTIRHPSLVHYISLLQETNFLTWVANTMLVAVVGDRHLPPARDHAGLSTGAHAVSRGSAAGHRRWP